MHEFMDTVNKIQCTPCDEGKVIKPKRSIVTDVTFEEGLFAVGHSSFFREAVCRGDKWNFHFYIRDYFRQPLVTGPIHIYEGEILGGTPYPIVWDYYK